MLVLLLALVFGMGLLLSLVLLRLLFLVGRLVLVGSVNHILHLIKVLELKLSCSFVCQRLVALWRRLKFRLTGKAVHFLLLDLAAH